MKTLKKFYPGEIIRLGEAPSEEEGKKKPKIKEYVVIRQYPNHVLCRDHNGLRRCISNADLLCQGIIHDMPFTDEEGNPAPRPARRKRLRNV